MKISRRTFFEFAGASALVSSPLSRAIGAALAGNASYSMSCGAYAIPSPAGRPRVRWWWPGGYITPEQVEIEVNALADAGFGGFEIADVRDGFTVPMDPKIYGWGTDRWVAGVERALEVADRRGLKADITLGPHWPTGIPGVTPDHPAAAKELVHAEVALRGGQSFSGPLPRNTSQPTGASQHPTPPEVTPMLVSLQAWRVTGEEGTTAILDPESRIDLTSQVRDGAIEWTAPADGNWRLLVFWMRGTAQIQNMFRGARTQTSMLADPIPYAVDVYGKDGTTACIDFWESHLMPPRTRELMKRIGGNFFEDSLELNAVKEWSPNLPQEFRDSRGYDLLPYLPLMATAPRGQGGFGGPPGGGAGAPAGGGEAQGGPPGAAAPGTPAEGGPPGAAPDAGGAPAAPAGGAEMGPDGFMGGPGGGGSGPYRIAGVETERFEADLRATLTEMYALNRIKALGDWASKYGMGLRAQCSGLAASYCTVPEGDNGDNIESFSAKAAARDIGGHKILSDEAATFVGGQSGVADWRLLIFMLQRDYAGGVNQAVLHGMSYADSPDAIWPGFSSFGRMIGNDWGIRSPLWELASDATAYIGRLQGVLQTGRSQADVAVLGASFGGGIAGRPGRDGSSFGDQLHYAGYTRHHITEDLLTHPNAYVEDRILAPRGAGYHGLIVSQTPSMGVATAAQLLAYAKKKLPIILIGELPEDVPGMNEVERNKKRLADALAKLVKEKSVTRVPDEAAAVAALSEVGIEPTLGFSKPSRVLGVVRRDAGTDYFYLLNDTDASNALTLSLKGNGRLVRINLWNGDVEPVANYTQDGGRFNIPLSFGANEAVVLALTTDSNLCASGSVAFISKTPVDGAARQLNAWSLEAEDWQPGASATETNKVPHSLQLDTLAPWAQLPGLEDASGIGRYTTTVTMDGSTADGAWLDLGRVGGSFRVYVNGKQLPPANLFTARVDIGPYLEPGENRIEVMVATTLNNRLRADKLDGPSIFPGGMQFRSSQFSDQWQPPADADPMQAPKGEYLGAPIQDSSGGTGPRMSAGAGDPGGARSVQLYGLIGPVRLVPYRITTSEA